jgi:hypothetical protein
VVLLAVCAVARPVVLAPFRRCARPGPSTPDAAPRRAARGGGSYGLPLSRGLAGERQRSFDGSGLSLVRVMREGARAAPAPACASFYVGGLSRRLRRWGHDSNQQQALVSVSKQSARGSPRRARQRDARLTDLYRRTALGSHPRASLRRRLSPAGPVARALHRGFLCSRAASRDRGRWRVPRRTWAC